MVTDEYTPDEEREAILVGVGKLICDAIFHYSDSSTVASTVDK